MAGAACLAARKTLGRFVRTTWDGLDRGGYRPERVHPQNVHKVVGVDLAEQGVWPDSAGVGKEDVESAVPLERIVDHLLHRLLVGGVKLACVHVDLGPQGVDLALVRLEVGAIVVADVDGLGAVLGELMR